MDLLRKKGAEVLYSDPFVPGIPPLCKYTFELGSTSIAPEILRQVDCVLVATDHDDFDYQMIVRQTQLVVDTRRVFECELYNVVKA